MSKSFNEDRFKQKSDKFHSINCTINRSMGKKVRKDKLIKCYNDISVPNLRYKIKLGILTYSIQTHSSSADQKILHLLWNKTYSEPAESNSATTT
jgi:hypothetical protein